VDVTGSTGSAPRGPAIDVIFKTWWWMLSDSPVPPPRGATIDVFFNLGGGLCRTCRQRPLGGMPSTSSPTSVVDATGPTGSAPQGARHRCLATTGSYCRYPLPTPPRGPLVDYHYWACHKEGILREFFLDPCDAKDSKRNREEDIVQHDKKQSLFTR
jgi:hypothetical protein